MHQRLKVPAFSFATYFFPFLHHLNLNWAYIDIFNPHTDLWHSTHLKILFDLLHNYVKMDMFTLQLTSSKPSLACLSIWVFKRFTQNTIAVKSSLQWKSVDGKHHPMKAVNEFGTVLLSLLQSTKKLEKYVL